MDNHIKKTLIYRWIWILFLGMIILSSCDSKHDYAEEYALPAEDMLINDNDIASDGLDDQVDYLSEFFRENDSRWNDSTAYNSAVSAYNSVLNDIFQISEEKDFSAQPRFMTAYIDEDDLPELLVAYGDFHSEGVSVYRYEVSLDEVFYVGTFGSFGSMQYYEGTSIIVSYYGNMGAYSYYASKINKDNTVSLMDLWYIDGSGFSSEEIVYYHGFDLKEEGLDINGTKDMFSLLGLNELYIYGNINETTIISENEFLDGPNNWLNVDINHAVDVCYDSMYSINTL